RQVSNRPSPYAKPRSSGESRAPITPLTEKRGSSFDISGDYTKTPGCLQSGVSFCKINCCHLNLAEYQRTIGTAKTEGVGEHCIDFTLLRRVGHQIDITAFIRVVQIDGCRCDLIAIR